MILDCQHAMKRLVCWLAHWYLVLVVNRGTMCIKFASVNLCLVCCVNPVGWLWLLCCGPSSQVLFHAFQPPHLAWMQELYVLNATQLEEFVILPNWFVMEDLGAFCFCDFNWFRTYFMHIMQILWRAVDRSHGRWCWSTQVEWEPVRNHRSSSQGQQSCIHLLTVFLHCDRG